MQYTEIFKAAKLKKKKSIHFLDIFLILARNIDRGYMNTHNQCFEAKIRKIGILLQIPVSLYNSGVQGGIHYMDMFS